MGCRRGASAVIPRYQTQGAFPAVHWSTAAKAAYLLSKHAVDDSLAGGEAVIAGVMQELEL
jgi:hypothetical protein